MIFFWNSRRVFWNLPGWFPEADVLSAPAGALHLTGFTP